MANKEDGTQRGVQSVDMAAGLLERIIGFDGPVSLKQLAEAEGTSSARLFPYMVSLVRAGLLSKHEQTGRYSVGPLSQSLGILGLHYLDPVEAASGVVRELQASTGHAVALSIWGALGPTVVRLRESSVTLYSEVRLGAVMSLVNSSLGRIFSAYTPRRIIEVALEKEALRSAGQTLSEKEKKAFFGQLESIKARGYEFRIDTPMPTLSAISAPVFDLNGSLALVLTLYDETEHIDLGPEGKATVALCQQVKALSAQLGFVDKQ